MPSRESGSVALKGRWEQRREDGARARLSGHKSEEAYRRHDPPEDALKDRLERRPGAPSGVELDIHEGGSHDRLDVSSGGGDVLSATRLASKVSDMAALTDEEKEASLPFHKRMFRKMLPDSKEGDMLRDAIVRLPERKS